MAAPGDGRTPFFKHALRLALAVFLVAIVGAGWRVLLQKGAEPVYQGRTLRVWLRDHPPGTSAAVQAIGTNAIPVLLRMLARKDSAAFSVLADRWNRFWWNMPTWLRQRSLFLDLAVDVNMDAATGFEALGSDAWPATPALIKLYRQKVSLVSQSAAGLSLLAIGPAAQRTALPLFVQQTCSPDWEERRAAAILLGEVDIKTVDPGEVVPPLVSLLGDTNLPTRLWAMQALEHYGTNAQSAVPGLVRLLDDSNPSIRRVTTNTLLSIDPQAAAKGGIKEFK